MKKHKKKLSQFGQNTTDFLKKTKLHSIFSFLFNEKLSGQSISKASASFFYLFFLETSLMAVVLVLLLSLSTNVFN